MSQTIPATCFVLFALLTTPAAAHSENTPEAMRLQAEYDRYAAAFCKDVYAKDADTIDDKLLAVETRYVEVTGHEPVTRMRYWRKCPHD